jgi:polysaccharide biosynthesis/export protein
MATRILMRVMRRSLRWPAALLAGAVATFSSFSVHGQGAVPSAEQLELLRNLTPEQREQILRQLAGDGADQRSDGVRGERRSSQREGGEELPRDATRDEFRDLQRREDDEEREPLIPILKQEDSVIIRVNLPPQAQANRGAPGVGATVSAAPVAGPNAPVQQNQQLPQAAPTPSQREVELTEDDEERLRALIELIRSRNPYQLSREGVLQLPGFVGIPLAGLTEFQATIRLQAEPALRDLDINVIRLPLKKTGLQALKPFGYDLFDRAPSSFAPVTNVPVPADYVVGSGDELNVQLYGSQNRNLVLVVGRDGRINFPELGPISVGGQRFSAAKASIEARVERQMVGVRASVSMGDTRSIRVFVLGEAKRPGSYTISGLGSITSALFAAGGVKPIGSLRNIQLKRQGQVVRNLDLYDMLIRGDTTDDAKVLPGDVVFIPPIGPTVTVDGEVQRPAIYEVKGEKSVAEVISLAGGLTPEADSARASLTRIDENRKRVVLQADVAGSAVSAQPLRNGDLIRVSRLRPTLDAGVLVHGHVHAPAAFAFREGMKLTDVVSSVDELKPNADLHYLLIRRELPPDRRVVALSADLGAALLSPDSPANVPLMPRDQVTVFDLETGRDRVIKSLVDDIRLQSTSASPTELVRIDGRARVSGEYPLEPGMKVSDLIRAGGGLTDAAYGGTAELTRYRVINGESRRTELIKVDIAAALRGDPAADINLEPFDSLSIKEVPEWGSLEEVRLDGEVRFPGRYSIKRGETLNSVIARAGGLTEYAFPQGSIFTRADLKKREQKQLDVLATRLQNDLATLALQGAAANQAQAGTALTVGQALLSQVRASEAVGRLVIDLRRTTRSPVGSAADIVLRDGDRLLVPKFQQEVTVIGEVQTATSHLFRPELERNEYISLSGGTTRRADRDKIYVVRADGSVVSNESGRWFSQGSVAIQPGDTIVVPLDTERLPALPFWQAVTQIIYNLAISAAAIDSFRD